MGDVFIIVALAVLVLAGGALYAYMTLTTSQRAQQRDVEERQIALGRLATVVEHSLPQRLTPEAAAGLAEQFSQALGPDARCLDKARSVIAAARLQRPSPAIRSSIRPGEQDARASRLSLSL